MKIVLLSIVLAGLGIGSLAAQTKWRGNYFGRSSVDSSEDGFSTTGTIQQTINDFRSPRPRGTIRSSLVAASNDIIALSARDVLKVRGKRVSLQTSFTSPCGCSGEGNVRLTGKATVRRRSMSYSAVSADGSYSLRGSLRLTRNGMVRKETRTIWDEDFDTWDTFRFSSTLFLFNRRGR